MANLPLDPMYLEITLGVEYLNLSNLVHFNQKMKVKR